LQGRVSFSKSAIVLLLENYIVKVRHGGLIGIRLILFRFECVLQPGSTSHEQRPDSFWIWVRRTHQLSSWLSLRASLSRRATVVVCRAPDGEFQIVFQIVEILFGSKRPFRKRSSML